ncbi:MAG: class I SAM-dependent methyltransferase [Gammaproteobacteria bacterium]|nr:class I SAM-dependent methyltransferase [Gammaproteobacteria bacterium]MYB37519.1 class I SAM-dependent methyltransferase [Gammaproteobacteria bacterium]
MSEADRERWNGRYAAGEYGERSWPSDFLTESMERLPRGRALDLACGLGRNARFLAENGWQVDAVDVSDVALRKAEALAPNADIRWIASDLEQAFTPSADYDLVLNIRYVNLPLLTGIRSALRPGGALLVEQHLTLPDLPDDVVGPKNPRFRVAPGALQTLAEGLRVEIDEEGLFQDPDGETAALARLLAFRT